MKFKQLNYITLLAIIISFFLGRQSVGVVGTSNELPSQYLSDSSGLPNTYLIQKPFLEEKSTDTVFRCGKSRIYHPTKTHASFKRCKPKVYELTAKRAKELGMRHCKCSY